MVLNYCTKTEKKTTECFLDYWKRVYSMTTLKSNDVIITFSLFYNKKSEKNMLRTHKVEKITIYQTLHELN